MGRWVLFTWNRFRRQGDSVGLHPFIGTFLSIALTGEGFSRAFLPVLAGMLAGIGFVVLDTLAQENAV